MGFKGYENSECPLADCPKNCDHSRKTNNTQPFATLSIEDPDYITRVRLPRYGSSQSTGSTSTTATDDSRSITSAGPSRVQSNSTTPNNSPSPEKQKTKEKESIYRKAPWQPSLAAGGPVDLLNTFTPTTHGTFSFGGIAKGTPGTAEITLKKFARKSENLSLEFSATPDGMNPPTSSVGNFLPLIDATPASANKPTPTQAHRANDTSDAPAISSTDGAGDDSVPAVPAVPLAAPSTNAPYAPTSQDAVDGSVTTRASAKVEVDASGEAREGIEHIPHSNGIGNAGTNSATNGLTNGAAGAAGACGTLFARRRAGTGGSNPMVESSLVGAATIPIHPDDLLRREQTAPAPLMESARPALPSSTSSYSRRLSEASRDEIDKLRAIKR